MKRRCYLWILLVWVIFVQSPVVAQSDSILHRFSGRRDGAVSTAALVSDASGNLYGTTIYAGDLACNFPRPGCGTVFELERATNGVWRFRTLYQFHGGEDGANPAAGLLLDSNGNLYGTTAYGGGPMGNGTVFELQRSGGHWTEIVLFRFNRNNGFVPSAPLTWGPDGALYGTTAYGGLHECEAYHLGTPGCGVVYRLAKTSAGWAETVLHVFQGLDGAQTYGGVTFDQAGNIYGTAWRGGTGGGLWGGGSIYELTRSGKRWTETTIYNFPGYTGGPVGEVVFDQQGNLYGAAEYGGTYGYGSVFELSPSGATWTLSTLHSFMGLSDGWFPLAGIVLDADGNIFGATSGGPAGTCQLGCGLVFRLDKLNGWAETVLHDFEGGRDGGVPWARVLVGRDRNLYGTTFVGGDDDCKEETDPGCGTVFEIRKDNN